MEYDLGVSFPGIFLMLFLPYEAEMSRLGDVNGLCFVTVLPLDRASKELAVSSVQVC